MSRAAATRPTTKTQISWSTTTSWTSSTICPSHLAETPNGRCNAPVVSTVAVLGSKFCWTRLYGLEPRLTMRYVNPQVVFGLSQCHSHCRSWCAGTAICYVFSGMAWRHGRVGAVLDYQVSGPHSADGFVLNLVATKVPLCPFLVVYVECSSIRTERNIPHFALQFIHSLAAGPNARDGWQTVQQIS